MHLSLKSGLGKLQLFLSRVLSGRVLDLFGSFTQDDTTVSDSSGEGNNATLYSGRYVATDGVADKGIQANVTAAGSADYYLTGKVRPTGTSCRVQINDAASGEDDITGLTSGVWQDFTSATFSAQTASNVAIGWSSNSGFLAVACDWSDVRLINATTGATVARWQLNESADGDLNGYPALDSSGNGYHGTHTGCAGGTGEAGILQTAGMDWNKRMWFQELSNDYVSIPTSSVLFDGGGTIEATFVAFENGSARIWEQGAAGSGQQHRLLVGTFSGGLADITFRYRWSTSGDAIWQTNSALVTAGVPCHLSVSYNADSVDNDPVITVNGVVADITEIVSPAGSRSVADTDLIIGNSETFNAGFGGFIYDININGTSAYQGYGNTDADWVDTIGSNNGTVNGTPSNFLIPESDTTAGQDALGNAIAEPRPTAATFNFFGDGEYAEVADADSLDVTTAATWEIWGNFYYDLSAATQGLMTKDVPAGVGNRSWSIVKTPTLAADEVLVALSNTGTLVATSVIDSIPDANCCLSFVYNGAGATPADRLKGYINGAQITLTFPFGTIPTSLFVSTTPVVVGAYGDTALPTDKQISRPKIYNRALTADEVLQNFNAQKSSFGL